LFTGDGAWARTSEFAEPGSLYRAQLAERLGANALGALGNAGRGESAAGTPALEVVIPDLQKQLADRREAADIRAPGLALKNGWLVAADSLLTGRQTGVTWWRGRLD